MANQLAVPDEELLAGHKVREAKRAGVSDAVVAKALGAYEDMPAGTGREDRKRVAIAAILKHKPKEEEET